MVTGSPSRKSAKPLPEYAAPALVLAVFEPLNEKTP